MKQNKKTKKSKSKKKKSKNKNQANNKNNIKQNNATAREQLLQIPLLPEYNTQNSENEEVKMTILHILVNMLKRHSVKI